MLFLDGAAVRAELTYERCIAIVRKAMIAFSLGETRQVLRSIIPLAQGRMFGVMPGAMGERGVFGAKLVSVFPENFSLGRPSHQGVVALFDPENGAPVCIADASAITAIRTASASAAASDALARPDASRLALLGYGEQAHAHAHAISKVRRLSSVCIWGRSGERAQRLAATLADELGIVAVAALSAEGAVADADIVCTVTAAKEPILEARWLRPGTHLNIVGSSYAGPAEVDNATVAAARFIVDSRASVVAQGAEFIRAREAGLVDESCIVGEIGEVFAGRIDGRRSDGEITAYKSLGHVVQDLAAAWALYEAARMQ